MPIPATSLVPFALLPLFGIVDHKTIAYAASASGIGTLIRNTNNPQNPLLA